MKSDSHKSTLYPVLKLVKVMRSVLLLVFLMLVGMVVLAGTNTTNVTVLNTQLQQVAQNVPPPPSDFLNEVIHFLTIPYNFFVTQIQSFLQNTVLKTDPQIADTYANIIAWLTTLTAFYIILVLLESIRKLLGYIILFGWVIILSLLIFAK